MEDVSVTGTHERVNRWFRAKRDEMLAAARLPEDHSALIGGHRESVVRSFLEAFMPSRLSVGRGIVYSPFSRSGECDVVIWDSTNFPQLPMFDHASFFVESVSFVIEVKSTYSKTELEQSVERCRTLRQLSIHGGSDRVMLQVAHHLDELFVRVSALEGGLEYEGMMSTGTRLPYGVIFLTGGATVELDHVLEAIDPSTEERGVRPDVDDIPSFICFVEAGRFIRRFEPSLAEVEAGEEPFMARYEPGDVVLAEMTNEILRCIRTRSPGLDGVWDLSRYTGPFFPVEPEESVGLEFSRMPSGFRAFWRNI